MFLAQDTPKKKLFNRSISSSSLFFHSDRHKLVRYLAKFPLVRFSLSLTYFKSEDKKNKLKV